MTAVMDREQEGYRDLRLLVDVTPPKFDFLDQSQKHSAAHQAQLNQQATSGPMPKLVSTQDDQRPVSSDSVSLKSGDNGHIVIQPKDLMAEPGDRSRPVTKEKGKTKGVSRQANRGNVAEEAGVEEEEFTDNRNGAGRTQRQDQGPKVMEFDNSFDLMDEESWVNVPSNHAVGRFNQFRQLTYTKISDLEGRIEETVAKTHRKINTLKAQFQEHKHKWEMERQALIEHIGQAVSLHEQAEQEADAAISQLDEFITDQEQLEKEEDTKRTALGGDTSRASDSGEGENRALTTRDEGEPIAQPEQQKGGESSAITPEELLRTSAQSRASLREQHRQVLSSLKASSDIRRSRSPSILSIKDQKSVLQDAELDEDGDMPFPPDHTKEERDQRDRKASLHDMGTSPMILQREKTTDTLLSKIGPIDFWKSVPMIQHPVVQEFLKAYDGVIHFKRNLGQIFMDKEITSAGQILNDIEPIEVDGDIKIQPQLEALTKQVYEITEECANLITSIVTNDKDYMVSSVANLSQDPTRTSIFTRDPTLMSGKHRSGTSPNTTDNQIQELQQHYINLQSQFENEKMKYNDQLQHNTVLMMEMQDTINALKHELALVVDSSAKRHPKGPSAPPDSPIMFTRLDSDRNSKVMKKAVNEKRLSISKYQDAVDTMQDYTSLPAKRFVSLVHKYIHHHQMKEIEENVRTSNAMNNSVYHVLDKMESLQNDRAKRWADRMDDMTAERMRLAGMLMDTLENIEKESGIFLIKPIYTYRAPYNSDKYKGKLSRPFRANQEYGRAVSSIGPAPTPASNTRLYHSQSHVITDQHVPKMQESDPRADMHSNANIDTGISGKASQLIGDYPRPVWMPNAAQSKPMEPGDENYLAYNYSLNTPKMLELDINRMLIGQNQISAKIQPNFTSTDRLANAANSTVRGYVTVNRNIGSTLDRHTSHPGASEGSAPPTTPMRGPTPYSSAVGERKYMGDASEREVHSAGSRNIPSSSPLPPIQSRELPIPPMSPPGSSLRQTPPVHIGMEI